MMMVTRGATRSVSALLFIVWLGACSSDDGTDTSDKKNGVVGGPAMTGTGGSATANNGNNGGAIPGGNNGSSTGSGGSHASGSGNGTGSGGATSMNPMQTGTGGGNAMMGIAGAGPMGGGSGGSQSTGVPLTPTGDLCLQAGNGNYTAPGPYAVAKMNIDLGMIEATQHTGKYTIYYPNPMEANCLHPIVAWGNGTGVTDSDGTYDFLNSNAASWGMVVASSSEDNTGSGNFHKAGIDWLLAQNMDPSSMFYQKLSTRAGVGGHSQGGFGASIGAQHPNVVTAAIEGATMASSTKVSVLIMTGTEDIVQGVENLTAGAQGPMFLADWNKGNHVGTETVLGFIGLDTTGMATAAESQMGAQQFQRLYAAWFRCFLADDQTACKLFSGGTPDNCGICKDPGWYLLSSANL
jgi:hypothetical protein